MLKANEAIASINVLIEMASSLSKETFQVNKTNDSSISSLGDEIVDASSTIALNFQHGKIPSDRYPLMQNLLNNIIRGAKAYDKFLKDTESKIPNVTDRIINILENCTNLPSLIGLK
jgi:hypothetical protein